MVISTIPDVFFLISTRYGFHFFFFFDNIPSRSLLAPFFMFLLSKIPYSTPICLLLLSIIFL